MNTFEDFSLFEENIIYSPWLGLPSDSWNILTKLGKLETYKKNTILYNCNESCNYVYLVKSGRVEVYINNSQGYKKIIGICTKGSLFGELQLFDNKPNFCTSRVCSDAQIYKVPKAEFMNAIFTNKELLMVILESISSKIRILYTAIEFLSFRSSNARVALILISMCKDFGVKLKNEYKLNITFTHNDIANMTGLSRVSVSNIMIDFANSGVLRKEGNEYFILDLDYFIDLVK